MSTPALDAPVSALTPVDARMAAELRRTLSDDPPWIPSQYLYDDRGLILFEEITHTPEYYQTRTEEALLSSVADAVVERAAPADVLELGSGAGRKIRLLLDRVTLREKRARCVLLDINEVSVRAAQKRLREAYPGLEVLGLVGDFREPPSLPRRGRRLVLFLAGTIGNLHPYAVPPFLTRLGQTLAPADCLLVGLDLVKEKGRLEAAYNDSRGATARFNRNVLSVVNRRLGADFEPTAFEHVAFYDEARSWIEMRLRARRAQRVVVPACALELSLAAGDEIRTEISCKYTRGTFLRLLEGTGFRCRRFYTDPDALFALALLEREGGGAY
jgi:L-histidine N-alpha-methyltransferase